MHMEFLYIYLKERLNLTNIKLMVTGAQAWASVTGPLTSGMVGIPVTIEYDEAWDGLTKNLMCRCSPWGSNDGENRTILNVGENATVAHEVMQSDMYLYLGVEGFSSDGQLVIPTTWAKCGKIEYGANTCEDPSTDPELSVWNQLQTEIEQIKENALTKEQVTDIQACAQEATQAAQEATQAADEAKRAAANSEASSLYYTPEVTQPTSGTLKFEFKPSVIGAPVPKPVTVELPVSENPDENVYELPVATSSALGGVMPVAKTDRMTQPVGVDEDGRLFSVKQANNSIVVAAADTADALKAGADHICTGTNDQIIIQQAIDSLDAGTVLLLGGTYAITSEINPKSNVNIEGSGNPVLQLQDRVTSAVTAAVAYESNVISVADPELFLVGQRIGIKEGTAYSWIGRITAIDNATLTVDSAGASQDFTTAAVVFTDPSVISGYGVEDVTVSGLIIDGNREALAGFTSDTNYGANGIQFDRGSHIRVTGNTVRNIYKHGILFTFGPTDSYITDNIVSECNTHGIDLYGNTANIKAERCVVVNNNLYKANIQCHNGSHNAVIGNVLRDCRIVTQETGGDNLIANNTIIMEAGGGSQAIQTTGTNADRNVIVGNRIYGNGKLHQGVQLDGASGTVFAANYITGVYGAAIHLYKADQCHVHDNTVIGCTQTRAEAAIKLEQTCTGNRINGNYCVGTADKTTYGVEELSEASGKNYVDNNVFINAGSGAVHLLGTDSVERDNVVMG